MTNKIWHAQAPANIALIKYMGKQADNTPTNVSFSYTLDHLNSLVELQYCPQATADYWQPFPASSFHLDRQEQRRFLNHLYRIKQQFDVTCYHFLVRSSNNFPGNAGLASSASSYAALTQAACAALADLTQSDPLSIPQQAYLSQKGSGSSCRSFFRPWCLWQQNTIAPIQLPYSQLIHQVILTETAKKAVSSSLAHQRVQTSLLFKARPQRAQIRYQQLINVLKQQQWHNAYQLCWQEFWDMHALFATADPPFQYINPASLTVLEALKQVWYREQDGPIITMDAGPNVHCLYRPDQLSLAHKIAARLSNDFQVLTNDEYHVSG